MRSSRQDPGRAAHLVQGHRFPAEVVYQAVWLYFRFSLSLCDVEELMAARGVEVSSETIRC